MGKRTRDEVVDFVRMFALFGVVAFHCVSTAVTVSAGDSIQARALLWSAQGAPYWIVWLIPQMPLFFFAGAAVNVGAWRPNQSWGTWMMGRTIRLYRPIFFFIAFWAVFSTVLDLTGLPDGAAAAASHGLNLLWFVGAYLLVLAFMPLLARITTGRRLWRTALTLLAMTALVDIGAYAGGAHWGFGWINMLFVWLLPAALGVGYRRLLIGTRIAGVVAASALVAAVALGIYGPYLPALTGNMPPTLLLAMTAIVESLGVIALAPAIRQWMSSARVRQLAEKVNAASMTIYLWHWPVFMIGGAVIAGRGLDLAGTGNAGFLLVWMMVTAIVAAITAQLVHMLRPLEHRPLRWWDDPIAATTQTRSSAAGILILIAAVLTIIDARLGEATPYGGLSPTGRWLVLSYLVALVGARLLTHERPCTQDGAPSAHDSQCPGPTH